MLEIPTVSDIIFPVFSVIREGLRSFWYLVVPPALFLIFAELWLVYVQKRYISNIKWVMLEVTVPKEVMKTPKAMEQVFAGLSIIQSGINFVEKWWKGKVQEWVSFEVVGYQGTTKFYFRAPVYFKNVVEAQIFSQYAQAEIREVEDYTERAPAAIPSKEYDLWGTELVLDKEDAYPIRTYPEFEESQEEKRIDPMAALAEAASHIRENEALWIQVLLRPAPKDWKEKGEKLVNKLIGRKETKPLGLFRLIVAFVDEFFTGLVHAAFDLPPVEGAAATPQKSEGPETKIQFLSPGQKDVVERIEKKLAKLGFSAGIRFVYWGRQDIFTKSNVAAALSYFRQFNTMNMNAFKPNKEVTPSIDYWFKARREFVRKTVLWSAYKGRAFPKKTGVLNIEELATICHYPTVFVEAPTVYRIESRKGGPPPTLPIEE